MQLISALTLFLGLAAAAPQEIPRTASPSKVVIHDISLLGSGCPKNSADIQVDATGTIFEATFSEYSVATGPGTTARDWRKNCKLTINMEFDEGFQFSILDTNMAGFAELPKGSRGTCKNQFSFSQNPLNRATTNLNMKGPFSNNFDLTSKTGIESWSPCGGSTAILNMNTQCSLTPTHLPALIAVRRLHFPPPSQTAGLNATGLAPGNATGAGSSNVPVLWHNGTDSGVTQVDNISGVLKVKFAVQWRQCRRH